MEQQPSNQNAGCQKLGVKSQLKAEALAWTAGWFPTALTISAPSSLPLR